MFGAWLDVMAHGELAFRCIYCKIESGKSSLSSDNPDLDCQ